MHKRLLTVFIFVLSASLLFSQGVETEAPENSEFTKWKKYKLKTGLSTGDIPPPVLANHDWLIAETKKATLVFDEVYDLRTLGLVTVAKDQGSCGACWTFGTLGSLESAMLKQGFGTFNFSEQNIRTCHGFIFGDNLACSGGNNRKSTAYLTRGDGPLLESDIPYNAFNDATCSKRESPQFTIYDVNYYPNDANVIKQAILDYGALYTNMNYQSTSYSVYNNTYYYNGDESTNHAVLLVGWDDNKSTHAGTGAWIIRNSWGDDWGDQGFFHIAYQDTKINSSPASFNGIEDKNEGDIIHMYDELGWISSLGYGNGYALGLNKFTTSEAQTITSIGTFATASGAVIKATVYESKEGNFLINRLGSTEYAYFTYSGYHRIELIEPISLAADKDFYIEVEYATSTYNYPIPFEKAKDDYANPTIESNVGWISSSGTTWTSVGNDVLGKERDLSIRVYAQSMVSASSEIEKDQLSIQIYPQPANRELSLKLNADFINQSLVVISINGQLIYKRTITNTIEKLNLNNFAQGLYLLRIENTNGNLLAQKRFIKTD